MENLTHSLIGATLAELFVPRSATPAKRGFFFTAGVVAANLPDADLVYARITPPPLGYLLHHRGQTHTFVGIAAFGAAFGLLFLIPRVRRGLADCRGRFWGLAACALLSHIVADAWNSYGVHPFWPFDNHWYYGDAINIYEPWLWVILGITVALNTRTRTTKLALAAALIALPLTMTGLRMISPVVLGALAVAGAVWTIVAAGWSPRRRAGTSGVIAAAFVASMFVVNRVVRAKVGPSWDGAPRGELLDVIATPRAANPLCWSLILVERDRAADVYTLRRGTLSAVRGGCSREWESAWAPADTQSLTGLKALAAGDCWVKAWLRFGRAPYVRGERIADYRFGGAGEGNFSSMVIENGKACPMRVPPWEMPRADLLGAP